MYFGTSLCGFVLGTKKITSQNKIPASELYVAPGKFQSLLGGASFYYLWVIPFF
jgi:hypothetical protein